MNQLHFVVPIAVLAALTPNLARFAAVTVAVTAGMGVLLIFTAPAVGVGAAAGPFAATALAKTRTVVEAVLLIAGGGLILAHQYLTRRRGRSIALATCLVGTYILAAGFWPWNLEREEPLRSSTPVFDPARVTLQVSVGSLNNSPYNLLSGSVGKNIDGSYSLSGIPPELLVQVRSASPRLSAPDGTAVRTLGTIPTVPFYQYDPPAASAIAAALGGIPVHSFFLGGPSTTFVTVDGATFLRYKDSPVKLVDDLDLVVSRYEQAAELPLVSGSRYDRGSVHARINGLVPRVDGVTIVVVESSVNLLFSHSFHVVLQPTDPRLRGDPIYLLVNRGRKEAALVSQIMTRSSTNEIHLGGLLVQQRIELPFGGEGDRRAPAIDSQWLAGATLVRLERVPVAEFRRTAEIDLPKLGEPWLSVKAQNRGTTPKTVEPSVRDRPNAGIVIHVGKGGIITVDRQIVTAEQLEVLLVRAHKADANTTVLIVVDWVPQPGEMDPVLDACRLAGISKFGLRGNGE
jgi:biopolymer transport protein ExbD